MGAVEALEVRAVPMIATVGRCVLNDLESDRKAYLPSNWLLTDSGTSALTMAIIDAASSRDEAPGAEVIIPAYCCPDVLTAVRASGARPVLVDFEAGTTQLDTRLVAAAMTDRTVAVVAVDFLGLGERLEMLSRITRARGCKLIDDACQALPLRDRELRFADYRVHSFGRGKPVSLLHGGAVIGIRDRERADEILSARPASRDVWSARLRCTLFNIARHRHVFGAVRALGLAGRTVYSPPEPPGAMDDFVAARLGAAIDTARPDGGGAAARLIQSLRAGDAHDKLSLLAGDGAPRRHLLRLPLLARDYEKRQTLMRRFAAAGIAASPLYARILTEIPGTDLDDSTGRFPAAAGLADRLITLPLHAGMSADNFATIGRVLGAQQ